MGPINSSIPNLNTPLISDSLLSESYSNLPDHEEDIEIDLATINDPKITDELKHSHEYIELVTALEIEIERINTFYYRV